MMDDNPFRAEQEQRRMAKRIRQAAELHYQQQAVADYEHARGLRDRRAYERECELQRIGDGQQRAYADRRTDEVLDAMLAAIEGLRDAVRQMNAALVEMRKYAPPVQVVEFPANALRHSDSGRTRVGGGMMRY